eukprot:m.12879 g.12879  ORF g.12879 m.12879 type:complete len:305 (-) comp7078_c0_seq1:164-1078(-)
MTKKRRPLSSRSKAADENKKPIPPGFTPEEWNRKQELDAITEVVKDAVAGMVTGVMNAITEIEITRRYKSYIINDMLNCAHALVELTYLKRDNGEPPNSANDWMPDEEPDTIPIDTWAPGSVPIVALAPEDTRASSLLQSMTVDDSLDAKNMTTSQHSIAYSTTSRHSKGPSLEHHASSTRRTTMASDINQTSRTHSPRHNDARSKSSSANTQNANSARSPSLSRHSTSAPSRHSDLTHEDTRSSAVLPKPPPRTSMSGSARSRARRHAPPVAVRFEGNQHAVLPDIGQNNQQAAHVQNEPVER